MDGLRLVKTSSALLAVLALSACGQQSTRMSESELKERMNALEARQGTLDARESEIKQRELKVSTMAEQNEREHAERIAQTRQERAALEAARASATQSGTQMGTGQDIALLPPKSKPGQCFARVFVPPTYRTVTEQVLKTPASERVVVIPAKYRAAQKQVLVAEESERLEVVPATYKWVTERVMVQPATKRVMAVPARYRTVTEKVLMSPAHTVWKKGTGPIQKIDAATGEIMCLVEVPAEYKTVSKRVLASPATTKVVEQPAVYKTVRRQVVDKPAATRMVKIPAKYQTLKVTEEVSGPLQQRVPIPATYQTVSKQVMVSDGSMEWREILCETNMTRARVTDIQRSLSRAGYNPGPIDGVIGRETMSAVNAFQRAKGLPVDKYLNVATLQALGVSPR